MLGRKLVVPEVYDLMGQVQALMIRSQATPVRQACSAVRFGSWLGVAEIGATKIWTFCTVDCSRRRLEKIRHAASSCRPVFAAKARVIRICAVQASHHQGATSLHEHLHPICSVAL